MRTVFHVSDAEAYRTAERKVSNLLDDGSVEIDAVAVVVDSGAVIAALDSNLADATDGLTGMGATVKLCSNAARGVDAEAAAEPAGVELVPSGVGELTRLQTEGWAYIRL